MNVNLGPALQSVCRGSGIGSLSCSLPSSHRTGGSRFENGMETMAPSGVRRHPAPVDRQFAILSRRNHELCYHDGKAVITMIRTQVSLDEREYALAKKEARALGISLAEFVRRAIPRRAPCFRRWAVDAIRGIGRIGKPTIQPVDRRYCLWLQRLSLTSIPPLSLPSWIGRTATMRYLGGCFPPRRRFSGSALG
jgi:hypothetical protein